MDIYEFSQALWRRRWLLASGLALLLAFVVGMSIDFSNGVSLRSTAKYETNIEMAVVPDGYESLGQDLGSRSLTSEATLFASLLSSPQAAQEIEVQEGIRVLELDGSASGRDRFLTATVISDSLEGAVSGGLGAFRWLEQRISKPLITASAPAAAIPQPTLLDANGQYFGSVRIEADHALAINSEGLWIITKLADSDTYAFRLADAAEETSAVRTAALRPGESLSISLEGSEGQTFDGVRVPVPLLPEDGSPPYELIIGLERGLVRGTAEDPRLEGSYVTAFWRPSAPNAGSATDETAGGSDVNILLLTDAPVPETIGGRKTPLLIVAMMSAGIIALLVLAVAVDSWAEQRNRRQESGTFTVSMSPSTPAGHDAEDNLQRVRP